MALCKIILNNPDSFLATNKSNARKKKLEALRRRCSVGENDWREFGERSRHVDAVIASWIWLQTHVRFVWTFAIGRVVLMVEATVLSFYLLSMQREMGAEKLIKRSNSFVLYSKPIKSRLESLPKKLVMWIGGICCEIRFDNKLPTDACEAKESFEDTYSRWL